VVDPGNKVTETFLKKYSPSISYAIAFSIVTLESDALILAKLY
jgi:hypothetical protein